MNIRIVVAAFLLVALPLMGEAQAPTTPTPSTSPAPTPPPAAPKKKKHKPKPAAPAAPAAPAPTSPPAATAPAPVLKSAPVAAAPLPAPTGPIGSVALVTGSVTASSGAQTRSLGGGDPISEGETISVGPNSYASLKFNDGGRVLLRPNTEFAVESFRTRAPLPPVESAADKQLSTPVRVEGAAVFRLVRGGLRAISGLIGHGEQQNYGVKTPAATIGIRGTDYEVQTCSDDCPSQMKAISGVTDVAANELAGLELAQNSGGGGGGIIVATNEGAITLRTSSSETVVDAGKVALSLSNGQIVMLPHVPDLLLIHPTPSPKACE